MSSLIAELAAAAAAEKGLVFEEAMEDRLCAYSRVVAHFPSAVKEVRDACKPYRHVTRTSLICFFTVVIAFCLQFKWRNGWFYSLTEKAIGEGKADPCPLHTAWLKDLKVV